MPSIPSQIARTAIVSTTTQGAAAGLHARCLARATPAGSDDIDFRGVRAARLESGYAAVSQFHELRSALAGTKRFRRQPRAYALGARRMRERRCRSGPPPLGGALVRAGTAGRRRLHLSPRLGFHAAWVGSLLRDVHRRSACPTPSRRALGQAARADDRNRDKRLDLVRSRPDATTTPAFHRR